MTTYKLKNEYKIGIKKIDTQHSDFIGMVNKFTEINVNKTSRDDIIDIFNEIISYAHEHFKVEEAYFKEENYPEAAEHIKCHQDLLKDLNDIFFSFSEDETEKCINKITNFLMSWIEEHMLNIDKKFADFYLKKNKCIQK